MSSVAAVLVTVERVGFTNKGIEMNKYQVTMKVRKYNADGIYWDREFVVTASDEKDAIDKAIDAAHADKHETWHHVSVIPFNEDGTPKSLKQRMLEANLGLTEGDFANHSSDLYVVHKPAVVAWLRQNYKHHRNITCFTSPKDSNWNGAGKACLDIPFAHEKATA